MIHTPTIHVAGRHALTETGNNISYTCYRHTLHIFDYAVRLTAGGKQHTLERGDAALAIARTHVLMKRPHPRTILSFILTLTSQLNLILLMDFPYSASE